MQSLLLFLSLTGPASACLYSPPGPLLPPPSNRTCAPPIDDTSPAFTPWSHVPSCLRTNSTLSNTTAVYCLYTTPSNGTNIVTSPEVASSLLADGILTPSPVSPFQRAPELPQQPGDPPYRVTPIPGKGLGLVATRVLKMGEVFMVEHPALLLDVSFLRDAKAHHRRRLVKRGVERLGEDERREVMGLSRREAGGGYVVDEVLRVNAVAVGGGGQSGEGEGEEEGEGYGGFMGLFLGFSRINHDCQPNALYRFSSRTLTLEVFPYRTIQPGEEITVSYTPISMPLSERGTYLSQVWNITCRCPLCTSRSPSDISDSDHRRARIEELRLSVQQAIEQEYFENALVMAHEWLDLAEREGVPPPMAEWYDVVGRLSFDTGDLAAARRYALLSVDAWWRFGSADTAELEGARGWLRELGRLRGDVRLERRGVGNMFKDA